VEARRLGLVGGEDVREVRGAVELLLGRLDGTRAVKVVPAEHPGFSPAACGQMVWGDEVVGYLGKIDRSIADKLDLRSLPAAAELQMQSLLKGFQPVAQLRPLPKYPAVRRDLSLVVPEGVRFETIQKLVEQVHPEHLETLEYVGVYRGKPLEKGTKSQTISLVFRSASDTLTSQAVDESVKKVVDAAQRQGFKLRD
jgi:phenylalanyl-tRNA synthetase beta chain